MIHLAFLFFLPFSSQGNGTNVSFKPFPNGINDQDIVTVYVEHIEEAKSLTLNFYDLSSVTQLDAHDILAQVEVKRDSNNKATITTRCEIEKEWWDESEQTLSINGIAPATGWWRVDLLKIHKLRFAVFFQGFFAGVSYFRTSLDNIQSVYVYSAGGALNHDEDKLTIVTRTANGLPPMNSFDFSNITEWEMGMSDIPRGYANFSQFTHDADITMSTLIRPTEGRSATLGLRPKNATKGDKSMSLAIVHTLEGDESVIRLARIDQKGELAEQHVVIKRTINDTITDITMTVAYANEEDSSCTLQLEDSLLNPSGLDSPFELVGIGRAMPLNMHHTIPRRVVNHTV